MKHIKKAGIAKAPTGIAGLDELTHGGLPAGRVTLLTGGPGSGKTVMAIQTLVNGVRKDKEPGIFISAEESTSRIIANAETFGWKLEDLAEGSLFFYDAQPTPDLIHAGGFDLMGLLAGLEAQVKQMGAKRIVFDSIDVLLEMLGDEKDMRRELYRMHTWLLEQGLTAIITAKAFHGDDTSPRSQPLGFVQFMVDCALVLNHQLTEGVSQRSLRIIKYRGSSFAENQSPFIIGQNGLEVAGARQLLGKTPKASTERVSTGVERLDTMLSGGFHRASSILITGSPGTAKSTLGGSFVEAACKRGESAVFVSFDSDPLEIVRNLSSVNIDLASPLKKGLLHIAAARSGNRSAEAHLMWIKELVRKHKARCLVVDPVSALCNQGNEQTAHGVIERLIDWLKAEDITFLSTSLLDSTGSQFEGTPLQISTIADTWIHLSYSVQAGERNRALTIVKSRGTAHSHQVRELVLSYEGVTLADVYTAGGQVLMGTMRWEREQAVLAEQTKAAAGAQQTLKEMEQAELELSAKVLALEGEIEAKRSARLQLEKTIHQSLEGRVENRSELDRIRGADTANKKIRRSRAKNL